MPAASTLRRAALAAALSGALVWAGVDREAGQLLLEEDACEAGDEACSLSFRQLRGEQKTADVNEHFRAPDAAEAPATAAASEASAPAAAKEDAADAADADAEGEEDDEPAQPAAAAKEEAKPAKKASKKSKKKAAAEAEDEEDDEEGGEDDEDDEDDEEGEDDEDEILRGEFCCQFGQGKGATNLKDVGASCYPSAKPELYDFCDDKAACASDCNGTWVTGFCAFNATGGSEDPCALELNGYGTGYDYTGSPSRAVMNDTCASSESACGGCNGTWCHYVKTPIY